MSNTQIVLSDPDPAWGQPGDALLHVVLVHPEIPGNTGNIARLCAGAGAVLHLVEPLGFKLQDRYLRRAGLDYWPNVTLCVHPDWDAVAAIFPRERMWLFTAKAERLYWDVEMPPGAVLVFGRETTGLGEAMRDEFDDRLVTIPITEGVRSLNLANAVALGVYEGVRQGRG